MKKCYLIAFAAITCACSQVAAQNKLSLNKTVIDSTSESSAYPGSNAVDNSLTTIWSSQYVYKQSLTIDLGVVCNITSVSITWANGYYATVFDILFSTNGASWSVAKTFPANTNGTVMNIDSLSGQARYVKFQGRGRANTTKSYQIADFSVYGTPTAVQQAEINALIARLQGGYTQDAISGSEINTLYNSIQANGSWTDISYTNTGNWPTHAERLQKMALAYNKPGTYYKSATMRDKIASGLSFLNRTRPTYYTWFEAAIGAPRQYAIALLIIKNDINRDSALLYSTYLKDDTNNSANLGMNRAWASSITIHKGCIEDDYWLVDKGFKTMATCLDIVTGSNTEGPRVDGSFHQHHNQLQSGSYGKMFLEYFADYTRFSNGLAVDSYFTTTRKATLRSLFLEGLRLLSYKKNVDFGTAGREVSRNLSTSLLISSPMLDTMALNDPTNAVAYQNWRDHLNLGTPLSDTSIKYFWKSSILTTRYPGFYMSAKVISKRGYGTESLNDENIKGYYLPMGATNIMRTGSEYKGIFPIWRWCRIPGITAELSEDSTKLSGYMIGTNDFGGGLSQSDGGIIAYEHDYKGVKAKKAYIFMNNQMICLGAGIYGTRPNEVATSLDQAFTNGTVSYSNGTGTQTFTGDSLTANTFTWMHHNNIGYIIPNGGLMTLLNKTQSGSWQELRLKNDPATITDTVFSAYFRHSANPSNRHYSYIVAPNVPLSAMDSLYNNTGYTFPRNEPDIQALRSAGQYTKYAVVFYTPGSVDMGDGLTITSSQKAIVLIKEYTTNYRVSVADPLYNQGSITITLNKQLTGPGTSYANGVTTINFTLPTGEDTGSTKTGFYSKVAGSLMATEIMAAPTDLATNNGVKVYPNPARSFVELAGYDGSSGNARISLLDAQGRVLKHIPATASPVHISTTGLPSGKYYLRVEDKKKGNKSYPFLIVR